ncbi:MAG: hypothetical protein JWN81_402 [Solirubrobacterales bacterium]|nr:hypothetical protein [Solirubrobacterales bacterium]
MEREPDARQERATEGLPEASDRLPEEGPGRQVAEDVPEAAEGAAREAARRHARRVGGPYPEHQHGQMGGPGGV